MNTYIFSFKGITKVFVQVVTPQSPLLHCLLHSCPCCALLLLKTTRCPGVRPISAQAEWIGELPCVCIQFG